MKGEMLNMYTDEQGEQQTALVGNIYDLRSLKIKEIGGVPIEKIQAHYEIQRDRAGRKDRGFPDRVMGFPEQSSLRLPPDTVKVYKVNNSIARSRWHNVHHCSGTSACNHTLQSALHHVEVD